MCFVVKDEEYITPPMREKRIRRVDRASIEREERRQSVPVPRRPTSARDSRAFEETRRVTRIETRVPSRGPSRPRSTVASEAPAARTTTRSHHIEVDYESESSSSSSSSEEDVRSRATHRTAKSSHTHKSSKAPSAAPTAPTAPTEPLSEYSMHEKEREYRREYSRPRNQYETYRYVDAPQSARRSRSTHRDVEDERASRDSVHRRITIEEDRDGNRRRFEYRN